MNWSHLLLLEPNFWHYKEPSSIEYVIHLFSESGVYFFISQDCEYQTQYHKNQWKIKQIVFVNSNDKIYLIKLYLVFCLFVTVHKIHYLLAWMTINNIYIKYMPFSFNNKIRVMFGVKYRDSIKYNKMRLKA